MKSALPPWAEGLLLPSTSNFADDGLEKAYILFLLSTMRTQNLPDCTGCAASRLDALEHQLSMLADLGLQVMAARKINVRIS